MTWNIPNLTLTDTISPLGGVTVGKLFLQKDEYICVILVDNGHFQTIGQLTQDEFEILSGCGDVCEFPPAFVAALGRKWLLCSTAPHAKDAFSEADLCSYWVYRVMHQ